jgi:hypothetical protein
MALHKRSLAPAAVAYGKIRNLAAFVPLAEHCGHVHLLTVLMLHCCCALLAALHARAPAAAEAASKQQEKHSLVSVWEEHEIKEGE